MALSTDVRLPKQQVAAFPGRCVQCRGGVIGSTVRVCSDAVGWWNFVLLSRGRLFCVEVPICARCKGRFLRLRRLRWVLTCLLALAGAVYALGPLSRYEGPLWLWYGSAIVALVMSPVVFWEFFFPPSFNLTPYSSSVIYEFRDQEYAEEFAALNGGVAR